MTALETVRLVRIDRRTFIGAITANATSRIAAMEVARSYHR